MRRYGRVHCGPPSMPWGRSRTSPDCLTHLAWPLAMNWSMMHWAVLEKSPNWASHSTSAFGFVIENPSSNPTRSKCQLRILTEKRITRDCCSVLTFISCETGSARLSCKDANFSGLKKPISGRKNYKPTKMLYLCSLRNIRPCNNISTYCFALGDILDFLDPNPHFKYGSISI